MSTAIGRPQQPPPLLARIKEDFYYSKMRRLMIKIAIVNNK